MSYFNGVSKEGRITLMAKKTLALLMTAVLTVSLFSGCAVSSTSSMEGTAQSTAETGDTAEETEDSAASDTGASDTLLIGLSASVTGASPACGLNAQQGAELAVQEINEAGGVLGKQLELYVADDGWVQESAINATNLICSEDVVAQIGPFPSSLVLAVENLVEQAGHPYLFGGTSPSLTETGNPWMFRVRASDSIMAELAATYAVETLGCQKIGLFTNSNDFGVGGRTVAEEYLTEKGVEYVVEVHNTGDTDMTSQILSLISQDVDGVIVWTDDAETALAARQFHDLGLDVPIVGSTAISTAQVNELCQPEWLDNWYSATDFTVTNPDEMVQDFTAAYQEAYDAEPEIYAATYYSSVYILADAIERAGSEDPAAIRDALAETDGLETVFGTMSVDDKGEMNWGGTICQMVDGKPQFIEYVSIEH